MGAGSLWVGMTIVHFLYVNTNGPEDFVEYIPDICKQHVMTYATRFQHIFRFQIWSIWEERKYIKLFPSVQLWKLSKVTSTPDHDYRKFDKKTFLEERERLHAARAFFKKANFIGTSTTSFVHEGKTIIFVDTLQDRTTPNTVSEFIETIQLGRIGGMEQEQFFEDLEFIRTHSPPHRSDNDMDGEMLHAWILPMGKKHGGPFDVLRSVLTAPTPLLRTEVSAYVIR